MRRILLLLAAALTIASCSPKIYPRTITVGFADFRPYVEEGFFLSPDPYPGDFESLGEISIKIVPGLRKYYRPDIRYETEKISVDEVLKIAVSEARELGADGIVDMRITEDLEFTVTGLCIIRKDK